MRDEMAGDGPRRELALPAGKEAAEKVAVGRPGDNFDHSGMTLTIRALHE